MITVKKKVFEPLEDTPPGSSLPFWIMMLAIIVIVGGIGWNMYDQYRIEEAKYLIGIERRKLDKIPQPRIKAPKPRQAPAVPKHNFEREAIKEI